jgi:uncharacterized membrane protein YkgB
MKVLLYILAIFSIMAGLGGLGNGDLAFGLSFILLGVSLLPPVQEKLKEAFPAQPRMFRLGLPILLFGVAIVAANFDSSSKKDKIMEADALMASAEKHFQNHLLDSAETVAARAEDIYEESNSTEWNRASVFLNSIAQYKSDSYKNTVLKNLTEDEYAELKSGKLKKEFVDDSVVNASFISFLADNKGNYADLRREAKKQLEAEKKEKEKEERIEREARRIAGSYVRQQMEGKIRNIFLDAVFDIKVAVKGKNNDRLVLTYPLFNDVWFRKFEKEGMFDTWHESGFVRVDMTDNYDYHKYMTWN